MAQGVGVEAGGAVGRAVGALVGGAFVGAGLVGVADGAGAVVEVGVAVGTGVSVAAGLTGKVAVAEGASAVRWSAVPVAATQASIWAWPVRRAASAVGASVAAANGVAEGAGGAWQAAARSATERPTITSRDVILFISACIVQDLAPRLLDASRARQGRKPASSQLVTCGPRPITILPLK